MKNSMHGGMVALTLVSYILCRHWQSTKLDCMTFASSQQGFLFLDHRMQTGRIPCVSLSRRFMQPQMYNFHVFALYNIYSESEMQFRCLKPILSAEFRAHTVCHRDRHATADNLPLFPKLA